MTLKLHLIFVKLVYVDIKTYVNLNKGKLKFNYYSSTIMLIKTPNLNAWVEME